jgi:acetylornithine/N-succinyldiaminopimelate aminotransferase
MQRPPRTRAARAAVARGAHKEATVSTFDPSFLMPITQRPTPVMVRGEGSWLWDRDGHRYLDFVQGWAVNCLGHCPEVVQAALAEQSTLLLNASPAYQTEPQAELARVLCKLAGMDHAFFGATGAEANEGAIKLARRWGSKHRAGAFEIITTHGSFHGRTLATMAASGKPGFDTRFPPAVPGFVKVPYADADAIARAITDKTVAVMLEPIQGEAGVVVPPDGYLRAVREITERAGVLLMLDEVQTGVGRTGTLFAAEHEHVRPDVMTLGKGLGGGIPLSALLATKAASCFDPGDQGGTFNGHPLSCAVGLAVIDVVSKPEFLAEVRARGEQVRAVLEATARSHGDAAPRGRGLLWALPLSEPIGPDVVRAALQQGLLINSPQPNLLRLMPALNVTAEEVREMAERLARVRGT